VSAPVPSSAARLAELLRLVECALNITDDEMKLLLRSSAVWSLLKTTRSDDFSADAVGWAIRVLQHVVDCDRTPGGGSAA